MRVLVVEDDGLSRVLIEEALSFMEDVRLTTASTLADGVILLSSQLVFDLVLLDWRLDGTPAQLILDVASQLGPGRRPRVVLVTGSLLPEEITSLVPSQIDRILTKPIELDDLIDVVLASAGGYQGGGVASESCLSA